MWGLLGSSFIGRRDEWGEVRRALENRRLVTLVGEGGVGKTRLAAEVARSVEDEGDLLVWVDLARVVDGSGVRAAFEDSLRPLGDPGGFDELLEPLASECFLVVVDNCEHVERVAAEYMGILTDRCRSATILATSRSRLGLPGERVVPIRPLDLPDPEASVEAAASSDAVTLLVDRLADAMGAFDLNLGNRDDLVALARATDGVPLAIELVAARAVALPLAELAASMDALTASASGTARSGRHRSLDASVRWSVDLLSPRAAEGLLALSVFGDSCGLETASALLGTDTIPVVEELVGASLLRLRGSRYRLPAAVRALAWSEVAARGDDAALKDRHAEVLATVARAARDGLGGPDPTVWLRRIDDELAELRAAMDWSAERGRPDLATSMLRSTYDHWIARGRYEEALDRLDRLLDHPRLSASAAVAAVATASILALLAGRLADAHAHADRLLSSGLDLDPETRVRALLNRAWCGFFSGREGDASRIRDLDEALEGAEAHGLGDVWGKALVWQGVLTLYAESIPRGQEMLGDAVAFLDGQGSRLEQLRARTFSAYGPALLGLDVDERSMIAEEAAHACHAVGSVGFEVMGLAALGTAAALRGDRGTAERRVVEAERLAAAHRLSTFTNIAARWRAFVTYRFDLPQAEAQAGRALALATATDNAWDAAAARWLLGAIAWRAGHREAARRHWETAAAGSSDPRYAFSGIRSGLGLALVDLAGDQFESASARVHGALMEAWEVGDRLALASAFDHLARVECDRRAFERAARLAGAADAILFESGVGRPPLEADLRAETDRLLDDGLGRVGARIAVDTGRALDEAAALRLVRRARGRRSRPVAGWDSLTPAEAEVAEQAAAGLANPQISDRLFMSRNTVKTHLSHVYAKLGVAGRTELAARWAAERNSS